MLDFKSQCQRIFSIRTRLLVAFVGSLAVLMATVSPVAAQDEKKVDPPKELELETKDRVLLKATYYPGTEGKKTVPIIMLHEYKGSRGDYDELAQLLQKQGHAVVIPDLRAHGGSSTIIGSERELDVDRLTPMQYMRMVEDDVETVKRFLMEENNAGKLNIERLCVIGAEMGAVIAMNWAVLDWSWPVLATGKQGQDVKALVLISPQQTFKGLNATGALTNEKFQEKISIYVIVGADRRRDLREAERIVNRIERFHPDPPREEIAEKKTLFFDKYPTSLQGTRMLGEDLALGNISLESRIAAFIKLRLVDKDFIWQDRSGPLD